MGTPVTNHNHTVIDTQIHTQTQLLSHTITDTYIYTNNHIHTVMDTHTHTQTQLISHTVTDTHIDTNLIDTHRQTPQKYT